MDLDDIQFPVVDYGHSYVCDSRNGIVPSD
jgi:hypothetical protein